MLSDNEIKAWYKGLAKRTAPRRQSMRLAALTVTRKLGLRVTVSYTLFQLLNLISVVLALVISACLLAFVLALEGLTIHHLLPWFLLMAVPLWAGLSYWFYSVTVRRLVVLPELAKNATRAANDSIVDDTDVELVNNKYATYLP